MVDNDLTGIGEGDLPKPLTPPNDDAAKAASEKAAADKLAADKLAADKAAQDKLAADKAAADEEVKRKAEGGNNNPEAVEIEGVKYQLDKDGNALDKDGKVFKSKQELDTLEEASEESLADIVIKGSGVQILDENGKPKVYEDTEEGLIQAAQDIADKKAELRFKTLIDSDPEFKEFLEYKQRGISITEYSKRKAESWKTVKLDENNENQLKDIVVTELVKKGMDKLQAEQTAELYKDTKRLKEFGKSAYQRLVNEEIATEKVEKENFEAALRQQEENNKTHWTGVKQLVTKGNINNVVIPENERDSFFNYVALDANGKGNSEADLAFNKLSIEQSLQLKYLLFKGLDLSKLVTLGVRKENVKSLRNKLNKNNSSSSEGLNKDQYKKGDIDKVLGVGEM